MNGLQRGKRATKESKDKRTMWLKVRLSKTEFDAIHELSIKNGVTISELIRLRVLGNDSKKPLK